MSSTQRSWGVPAALVALSIIPLTAGTLRLIQLAGGPELIPADSRFSSPLPLIIHIVSSAVFALVGAFQFARRFRRRHRPWHRRPGRVLVVAGPRCDAHRHPAPHRRSSPEQPLLLHVRQHGRRPPCPLT